MLRCFKEFLVASEKSAALDHFRVYDFNAREWHEVAFPRASTRAACHARRNITSRAFRFSYQSLITPASVYDYDMASRQTDA